MKLFSTKGRVACEPFTNTSVKVEAKGVGVIKVANIENKVTLTPLKVMVNSSGDIPVFAGNTVWVPSDHYVHGWAKQIFEVDGIKFILVPESSIMMVGHD